MIFIEKKECRKFCIWKDEMPFHCVSRDKKSLQFNSGEAHWHEGSICLEAYLRPTHVCNYAMIGMNYKRDSKANTANIIINYGEEDISFNSQVLPFHKEVSVGLEKEFVDAIEEFFVEYASKYALPGGTIEILFVGYDAVGSCNMSFKQTMELMVFLFKYIDHMEYEQLEKKILRWKYKNGKMQEMNKSIFHDNLMKTIYEIVDENTVDEKKIRFKIIPVYKKGKHYDGRDDLLRLFFLSEKNVGNRLLSVDTTVKLVAGQSPYVPVWINISFNRMEGDKMIFNFETSLNVRKPSLLMNQETGHAPFKAIITRNLNAVFIKAKEKKVYKNMEEFKNILEQLLSTDEDLILDWDTGVPEEWASVAKRNQGLACLLNIKLGIAFVCEKYLTEESFKAIESLYLEPVTHFELEEWAIDVDVLEKTTPEIVWGASQGVINTEKFSLLDLYWATV